MNSLIKKISFLTFYMLISNISFAQFSEARDYQNSPVSLNDINFEYDYISGSNSILPDIYNTAGNSFANYYSLTYTKNFSIGGNTASLETTFGYGSISSSAKGYILNSNTDTSEVNSNTVKGISDLSFVFTANILGAPAMSLKRFNNSDENNSVLSVRLFVSTPLGYYKKSDLTNIGANCWTFIPEIAFTKPFGDNFVLDIYSNVRFYTNNSEFLDSNTIAQNPVFGIDFHPSYTIIPSIDLWISIDGMLRFYGESSFNGFDQDDDFRQLMLGSTVETNISDNQSLSFQYLNNLFFGFDSPNNFQISASYSYTFY